MRESRVDHLAHTRCSAPSLSVCRHCRSQVVSLLVTPTRGVKSAHACAVVCVCFVQLIPLPFAFPMSSIPPSQTNPTAVDSAPSPPVPPPSAAIASEPPASSASDADPPAIPDASPAESAPSLLMLYLSRDTGSLFRTLQFTSLDELALLAQTSKTWREWLHAPGAITRRRRILVPHVVAMLAECAWIRPHIRTLEIMPPRPRAKSEPVDWAAAVETTEGAFKAITSGVFRSLFWLDLYTHIPRMDDDVMRVCFTVLGATLCHFALFAPEPHHAHSSELVDMVLKHAPLLQSVERFRIMGRVKSPSLIDLSSLQRMASLGHFVVGKGNDFCASRIQVRDLAACKRLHTVDCGSWMRKINSADAVEEFIEMRLEAEMEAASATAAASASSASSNKVDSAMVPLKSIHMGRTLLASAQWRALMRLAPSLESVWPYRIATALSSSEWAMLRGCVNLRKLSLCPSLDAESTFTTEDFLPSLVRLPTLTELQLGEQLTITETQLTMIVEDLPALSALMFFYTRLESPAPLEHAPSLINLSLRFCTGLKGEPSLFRSTLPPLRRIVDLKIEEPNAHLITKSQAGPLNATLLQRCPLLHADRFVQNCKVDPPTPETDV